jgi:hypothetical protein
MGYELTTLVVIGIDSCIATIIIKTKMEVFWGGIEE